MTTTLDSESQVTDAMRGDAAAIRIDVAFHLAILWDCCLN